MRKNTIRKSITLFSVLCLGTPVSAWAIGINTKNSDESKKVELLSTITNTLQTETVNSVDEMVNSSNTRDSQESVDISKDSFEDTLSSENNSETSEEIATNESSSTTPESTNSTVSNKVIEESNHSTNYATGLKTIGDWVVEEYGTSYLLRSYKGSDTNLVIPNKLNGRQICFNTWNFAPAYGVDKVTSIAFSTEGGKKVVFNDNGAGAAVLRFQDYTNLQSFDGTGLDISATLGDISYVFKDLTNLTSVNISNWSGTTNMNYLFSGCTALTSVQMPDTSQVKLMSRLFNSCSSLTNLNVSHFDTTNVTDMAYMFAGCSKLTSLDLSHFKTSNVTTMQNMFGNCRGLTNLNVSSFDTSNVTNMAYMFNNLSGLTSLDVSNFNTGKVTNMTYMFNGCSNLTSLNVTSFRTPLVNNMSRMFNGCSKVTNLDVTKFNTDKVMNMEYMFGNITIPILNLSSFNASRASIGMMFYSNKPIPLFVLTDDEKLKSYDYASSNRLIGGPVFNGNGGIFDNQKSTKTYFDSCAVSPKNPKLQLTTFKQFKKNLKPIRNNYLFESWQLSNGTEPTKDSDLFNPVTYIAQWTPSLINGNIPSQDVDNVKPGTSSIFGIAYMPKEIIVQSTQLGDRDFQSIPIQPTKDFHVAVRDQRMTTSNWTLTAQLIWDGNKLPNSSIQTTNSLGEVKKNLNTGTNSFQSSDFTNNDGSVEGEVNAVINSSAPSPIMTSYNSDIPHNGVYDYELGILSLNLTSPGTIPPGSYTGNINWNLQVGP